MPMPSERAVDARNAASSKSELERSKIKEGLAMLGGVVHGGYQVPSGSPLVLLVPSESL